METNPFFDTIARLTPLMRAGRLQECETVAIETLLALPKSPFHIVADLDIANDPVDIAAHCDRFFRTASMRFPVKAVYTEMNGFDINPDLWYCYLSIFDYDEGHDDFVRLSDWQLDDYYDYTIRGLEALQAVYASEVFKNKAYRDSAYLASLVVVTKFQRFMQTASQFMLLLRVPLYVTAHDFDYIARIIPGEPPSSTENLSLPFD